LELPKDDTNILKHVGVIINIVKITNTYCALLVEIKLNQNSIQEEIYEQGMPVVIWCRIFCLPACYIKI
jgi:hypothetical protein